MLQYGVISVKTDNEEQYFTVAGGVAEINPKHVIILADAAENVEEIDVQRAEEARKSAEARLGEGAPISKENYAAIQSALRRSRLRVDAVRRFRHGRKYRPQQKD
jgi:F-type H+-transporting ATPase subunit epsilon